MKDPVLDLFKKACNEKHTKCNPIFDIKVIKEKSLRIMRIIPIDEINAESRTDLDERYGEEDSEIFMGVLTVFIQLLFHKYAKEGKMFCSEKELFELNGKKIDDMPGIDKNEILFYNITKAYWSFKTFVWNNGGEDFDIGESGVYKKESYLGVEILKELENHFASMFFPSLWGAGFTHEQRQEMSRRILKQFGYFDEDEIDTIFLQMPLYKFNTNPQGGQPNDPISPTSFSSGPSGCMLPIIISLSSLALFFVFFII